MFLYIYFYLNLMIVCFIFCWSVSKTSIFSNLIISLLSSLWLWKGLFACIKRWSFGVSFLSSLSLYPCYSFRNLCFSQFLWYTKKICSLFIYFSFEILSFMISLIHIYCFYYRHYYLYFSRKINIYIYTTILIMKMICILYLYYYCLLHSHHKNYLKCKKLYYHYYLVDLFYIYI